MPGFFLGFKVAHFFYVMSEAKGLLQELAVEMIREIRLHGARKRPRFPGYCRFPEGLDCAPPFFQTGRILQD